MTLDPEDPMACLAKMASLALMVSLVLEEKRVK